jgi:group I intron endonuclease
MRSVGIYSITNTINDKLYIGSSVNIRARFNRHLSDLRLNRHENKHLQNSYNKYGEECFKFDIVTLCNEEELLAQEQILLDNLKPKLYNKNFIANKPPCLKGRKQTSEHIEKRVESYRNSGYKMSDEHRMQMSIRHKGKTCSGAHKWVAIEQLDLQGIRLAQFESITHASKYIDFDNWNKTKAGISMCLRGKNQTAYGYKWQYLRK